jgi:hypothetical protein
MQIKSIKLTCIHLSSSAPCRGRDRSAIITRRNTRTIRTSPRLESRPTNAEATTREGQNAAQPIWPFLKERERHVLNSLCCTSMIRVRHSGVPVAGRRQASVALGRVIPRTDTANTMRLEEYCIPTA